MAEMHAREVRADQRRPTLAYVEAEKYVYGRNWAPPVAQSYYPIMREQWPKHS
jgi:hypothetical protein